MLSHLRPALVILVLMTLLTGVAYPLAITGVAQAALPFQANGSLVTRDGIVVGSALIGQNFASDRYFHGRPSATNTPDPKDATKNIDAPYNAANSSGSNQGPTSKALLDAVKARVDALHAAGVADPVPADAATASGSGLDPHISPAYALAQVPVVAKARNLPPARVLALVEGQAQAPLFGLVGERVVDVLQLNLSLDKLPPG